MFSPSISFDFREEREGLIKPKAIHIFNPNTGEKSTTSNGIQEKEVKPEKKEEKEDKYVFIDSVYPGAEKVKVLKNHLKRILKRRATRSKNNLGKEVIGIPRAKLDGPMHGSRSRFAKKRPRDHNGRFYTKDELEQMRKQRYIDSAVEFLITNTVPGISAE